MVEKKMMRIYFYAALFAAAAVLIFGVCRLPRPWRDALRGKKTYIVGLAGLILPEAVQILQELQALSIHEYLGPQWSVRFAQTVGVLAIAARYLAKIEGAEK